MFRFGNTFSLIKIITRLYFDGTSSMVPILTCRKQLVLNITEILSTAIDLTGRSEPTFFHILPIVFPSPLDSDDLLVVIILHS